MAGRSLTKSKGFMVLAIEACRTSTNVAGYIGLEILTSVKLAT
jgi:hypothetical protein